VCVCMCVCVYVCVCMCVCEREIVCARETVCERERDCVCQRDRVCERKVPAVLVDVVEAELQDHVSVSSRGVGGSGHGYTSLHKSAGGSESTN